DATVTGVQTCALPISFGTSVGTKPSLDSSDPVAEQTETRPEPGAAQTGGAEAEPTSPRGKRRRGRRGGRGRRRSAAAPARVSPRSEERRVGKGAEVGT